MKKTNVNRHKEIAVALMLAGCLVLISSLYTTNIIADYIDNGTCSPFDLTKQDKGCGYGIAWQDELILQRSVWFVVTVIGIIQLRASWLLHRVAPSKAKLFRGINPSYYGYGIILGLIGVVGMVGLLRYTFELHNTVLNMLYACSRGLDNALPTDVYCHGQAISWSAVSITVGVVFAVLALIVTNLIASRILIRKARM